MFLYQFVQHRCAHEGSMKLADFTRAFKSAGGKMIRTAVVKELSRDFELTEKRGQTCIVGLSLCTSANKLRRFVDHNCLQADGLTCPLASIVRGSGVSRTKVIQQLTSWGFNISIVGGTTTVYGLGLKEAYV